MQLRKCRDSRWTDNCFVTPHSHTHTQREIDSTHVLLKCLPLCWTLRTSVVAVFPDDGSQSVCSDVLFTAHTDSRCCWLLTADCWLLAAACCPRSTRTHLGLIINVKLRPLQQQWMRVLLLLSVAVSSSSPSSSLPRLLATASCGIYGALATQLALVFFRSLACFVCHHGLAGQLIKCCAKCRRRWCSSSCQLLHKDFCFTNFGADTSLIKQYPASEPSRVAEYIH